MNKNNAGTLADILSKGTKKRKEKGSGTKKYDRNRKKCQLYRARVGKPRGKGVAGNKAGRNSG